MQTAASASSTPSQQPPRDLMVGEPGSPVGSSSDPRFSQYKIIRRNGSVVGFEPAKITIAMTKAFLAVNGGQGAASARIRDEVTRLTDAVVGALMKRKPEGGAIHIEEIQDQVELALMRGGEHEVARAYVLYREKRSQERAAQKKTEPARADSGISVVDNGIRRPLDIARLTELVAASCAGLEGADPARILKATLKDLYDGVAMDEVRKGVVPFLKVVNDTAVAVNQGGKRKGAVCTYLETWHLDIEEFLELRKNTGDDRRRTHDMNTANWIPDLFMKRVMEGGDWTLFSPADVPDLHDKFGRAFETAYVRYEEKCARGELRLFKKIPALQLWRRMLSMLFETGHPWITFKDACNVRSPQQHMGTVHSSNLCTEITLNTSETEIAVCNLGSVNLLAHMVETQSGGKTTWTLDQDKLKRTITTAMRMLDNVIDINYYAVAKARNSNLKHRPVGLGIMGFQDCLHQMHVPYASEAAVQFADASMEAVCYHAYWASTELARERGRYSSFKGSLWDRGVLPLDTLKLLRDERGGYVDIDESATLDWDALRARIAQHGMRNSNCVAIAPTATISNIIGVAASIEPEYQNIYVKSNLSGEFTVVNEHLVAELKKLDLWDDVMVADLKYFDGSLAKIDRVPAKMRELYATAFEVETKWIVEAGARRQKWIDQAQSLNIYMAGASGKKLDETYKHAWQRGLKTTYYLRTLAATSAEKSTGKGGELNAVTSGGHSTSAAPAEPEPKMCLITDPTCEACQ